MSHPSLRDVSVILEIAALAFIIGALVTARWETWRWKPPAMVGADHLRAHHDPHTGSVLAGVLAGLGAFLLALDITARLLS